MPDLVAHEETVRFYVMLGAFGAVALLEALLPGRAPIASVRGRWPVNIGLTVAMSALVAAVFPVLGVRVAALAADASFGLLHRLALPAPIAFVAGFLLLDLSRYAQHRLLHALPWLWRLHRVHHSDPEYDCTTALRFHPLEALATIVLQLAVVAAIGASPACVLAYEAANVALAFFAHANLALPPRLEAALRRVVVTPDLHRIHHSVRRDEASSNYGSVLPWWDAMLASYRANPVDGHAGLTTGLRNVRDARTRSVRWLLASPFRS